MTMILVLIGIILGSVGLDQLTKLLAVQYLKPIGSYPLWQNVLHLTYVENRGAAFGMLSNQRWVFMIFSTVAIIGLVVYLFRFCKEGKWVKVALAMIIGGGIGNMIDRLPPDTLCGVQRGGFLCVGRRGDAGHLVRAVDGDGIPEREKEKSRRNVGRA